MKNIPTDDDTNSDMTISQLRVLVAICDNDLNVTAAASQLNMAQPSVSKKLSMLEKKIGHPLFFRNGKRFQYETDLCRQVSGIAREILLRCDNIKALGAASDVAQISGRLVIGTTHTQARYVLPDVLGEFNREYPDVVINMVQGSPAELVRLVSSNLVDVVICTEALETNSNLRTLVLFEWNRSVIMEQGHPLTKVREITLQQLIRYPIVTYVEGMTGRRVFNDAFTRANLSPRVMISAADADVIKLYVRKGFGVGIIAEMAYEHEWDSDLAVRSLRHLFPPMHVRLAYQREKFLSKSMQRLIELFHDRTRKRNQNQSDD